MLRTELFRHFNCRNSFYPKSNVRRQFVPDKAVYWWIEYLDYDPPSYTAPHIINQVWADPDLDGKWQPKWNQLDGNINRYSYHCDYRIENGRPLNPVGRTGLVGRGLLGRWGPNHAADPIVTRWKRNMTDKSICIDERTKRPILQMVAIERHDNQMWAIPGGMVDPGENVSATLKREFQEEALNSQVSTEMLDDFFSKGREVYRGYVDDFRNTDNAWIETVAMNFHDESGDRVGKMDLNAGDDAVNVRWLDLNSELQLHANHIDMIKKVVEYLNAHW